MEPSKDVTPAFIDISEYRPNESEMEKASNSYLMSVVALMVGAPLPIINMLATLFFYLGNRRATPYVRWHCMQALLSQATIFIMNAVAFGWTMRIVFGGLVLSDSYIGYIITALVFNIVEFAITVNAAIQVRKGRHVEWPLWGTLTNEIYGNQLPVNK
ncbi:MAG: DUF4870 domain-containing protein [Flavipsychrobacter sp.]|nr:DUF4870 domain-containing protein [Flavipsychrobacter sp.]